MAPVGSLTLQRVDEGQRHDCVGTATTRKPIRRRRWRYVIIPLAAWSLLLH